MKRKGFHDLNSSFLMEFKFITLYAVHVSIEYVNTLFTCTLIAGEDSGCYYEGQPINFICVVSKVYGVLIWRGIGFVCTRDNTGENNMLPLLTADCSEEGSCGPYHATLSCLENGSYVSNLTFTANYAMNGEAIECSHLNQVVKTFPPLKVGGIYLHA